MQSTLNHGPVRLERTGDVGLIVIDNPPVNALGADVRAGLQACLRAFLHDDSLSAAVLRCAGKTFSAGADITEFGKPPRQPMLPDLLLEIEASPKPVVAALHGTALGGGLELALACHGRVAARDTRLGLPEVKLGLLPGAGGTQRLPRLTGLAAAAEMILGGDPVGAARALEIGLVDALAADDLVATALECARALATRDEVRRCSELPAPVADERFEAAAAAAIAKGRGASAPGRIVEVLRAGIALPFAQALQREREAFVEAVNDPQSKALRHLFFAERQAGKVDGEARSVERPGVVGAGTMGVGIAIAMADAGLPVIVVESNGEALARASARLDEHYEGLVRKGRLGAEAARVRREAISLSPGLEALAGADLVVEAIVENLAAKQALFRALDAIVAQATLLATNTSYLDVDAIVREVGGPGRTLGLHFFSPANVMRLVEVVRGTNTDATTLATATAFARKLGKLPVVCRNATGFVGNRMFTAYGRESQLLLLEGASPAQVDGALERFGMAMGPCAVYDLAGLDVGYRARRERTDLPDDPRFFRVADALCEAGRLGQKSGLGAYRYVPQGKGPTRREPDPQVDALISSEAARLGITRRSIDDAEIVERCILALVNEGARLLGEGVASRASDIDVVWANGYGFPRWRGGPLHHAQAQGLVHVLDRLRDLERRHGSRDWRPAPLLERGATSGTLEP